MRSSVFVFGSILAALSLTAGAAAAEESEYPVSFVERPLTLPRFTLAPQVEIDINRIGIDGLPGAQVLAGMQIGASFGITKNIEVGAIVLPIQFNNGAGYGGFFQGDETVGEPQVYGTFRFLHTETFDMGARLRLVFVPPKSVLGSGAIIEPSIPLLVHIGKLARFDAEVAVPIVVTGSSTTNDGGVRVSVAGGTAIGLEVPLRLAFDIIEPLHVGVSTGLRIEDFGHAGESTAIPLGIFAGYAIGEKRPIVDIDPFFSFYSFLTPGVNEPGQDKVNPGIFVLGVNARGYLYF